VKVRKRKIAPKARTKKGAKQANGAKNNGGRARTGSTTKKRKTAKKAKKKAARTNSRGNSDIAARMAETMTGEDRRSRAHQARVRALEQFQFKPGHKGGPGRPKGSISLTTKLRKMLALPVRMPGRSKADTNYTYADRMLEMAVAAVSLGDFKFFKEIFERIDGKVPDHVITESTKQMVSQQAVSVAQEVIEEVGKIVDRFLDDTQSDQFMDALAEALAARFEKEDEEEPETVLL
jgi:hypothetical protein